MKIIAVSDRYNGDDREFVVTIGKNELANLAGKMYASDLKEIKVGETIQVGRLYMKLNKLIEQKRELKSVIETLKKSTSLLESKQEFFEVFEQE